jgi:hypothetical protein
MTRHPTPAEPVESDALPVGGDPTLTRVKRGSRTQIFTKFGDVKSRISEQGDELNMGGDYGTR